MSENPLDSAIAIGERLCDQAIWAGRRATWLGDVKENVAGNWEVVHTSLQGDVYGGTAGVALFLSRLWSVVPHERYRETARAALAYSAEWCRTTRPTASLYNGSIGVACVVAEVAVTFADDELSTVARDLALDALDRLPEANDLISGRAGAIPALLYLSRTLGIAEAKRAAELMGDGLVAAAHRSDAYGASWRSDTGEDEPPLCGLAHGGSGIGYALGVLSHAAGEPRYGDVAAQAAKYERAWYRRDEGNWPDLREFSRNKLAKGESPPFPVFWCHGAIGIGLARLWQYEATGQSIFATEAEAAIQSALKQLSTVAAAGPVADGSVCHGVAGVAELLLEGGRVFDQPELLALAGEAALLVVDSAGDGEWPCGISEGGENPSLMLGIAGIGMVLLRIAEPAVAPVGLLYAPRMETARLIVQLKSEMGADQVRDSIATLSGLVRGSQVERVSRRGRVLLKVPRDADLDAALVRLNELSEVEYAEADVTDHTQSEG